MGYIESILTGQSSERSLMNGHEALGVFGIASSPEEVALIKPVARALLLRDALRANDFGGLEFGPEAKAILKGEAEVALIPAAQARAAAARRRHGRAQPDRRSAVRGIARETARTGAGGRRTALCDLPRFGTAGPWRRQGRPA